MNTKEELLPHQKFANYLKSKGIAVFPVSKQVDVSRFHLGEVLRGNRTLSEPLRAKLNAYLNTDF